jgi:preprotein translocase subunit SecE
MIEKVKSFFKEVKVEGGKVNYPSKDELIGSTWVVIVTVLVVSVFLGMIDMGLGKLINYIILR